MLKEKLQSIFNADYPGYKEFAEEVLRPIFCTDFELYPMPVPMEIELSAKNANIQSINRIGIINDNGNRGRNPIEVFDVTINNNAEITRSRVNIQTWIRSELGLYTHAFIVFHYANPFGRSWRLSYLYKPDTISGATDAKRYTYLLGKAFSAHTISRNFEKLASSLLNDDALLEAFSVQALSDDFFREYRQLYAEIIEYITGKVTKKISNKWQEVPSEKNGPNEKIMESFKSNEQRVRDYIKKMMGRLTFLYFIQRKGWLCRNQNFMRDLFFTSDKQDTFLDDVLEPLFFGVLNTGENREAVFAENGWDMSLLERWKDIKYLNGGLFEQTDDDRLECKLPKSCFKNIFNFFDKYNFTIDENDPSDAEIGIDPEMLGRIFESLLEDNKDKGAFYTPKEIVQYMCKASLKQYLLTHSTGAEQVIVGFVDNHKIETNDLTLVHSLAEHLKTVKICDPAIGSGAFPMGLLNEILACRRLIHNYLHREDNESFDALAVKREIIRNNIFGVDIEQGAVDIARLRFWLSIVVDADEPQPLPNLDYTIVRGNSLLTTFQGEHLNLDKEIDRRTRLGRELQHLFKLQETIYDQYGDPELQTAIDIKLKLLDIISIQLGIEQTDAKNIIDKTEDTLFDAANSRNKKNYLEAKKLMERKSRVKASINKLRISLQSSNMSLLKRAQIDIDFFDWNIMFSNIFANGGFDIVIGNPPYKIIEDDEKIKYNNFKILEGHVDLCELFIQQGFILSKSAGVLTYIHSNAVLTNLYSEKLRRFMAEHLGIQEISNFSMDVFSEPIVHTCITRCMKDAQTRDINIHKSIKSFSELQVPFDYSIGIKDIEQSKNFTFDISLNPHERALFKKLKDLNTLGELCYLRQCIKTGNDKIYVMHSATSLPDPWKKSLRGKGIGKYVVKEHDLYLKYGSWLARNWNNADFYERTKIAIREAGKFITACIDQDNSYFLSSIYAVYPKKEYDLNDLLYLLGILNSKFATFYIAKIAFELTEGAFTKMRTNQLARLPIPEYNIKISQEIIHKTKEVISIKKIHEDTNTEDLENGIDKLVYYLYGLTYDEVLIVDPTTLISREEYENFKI